MTSAGEGVKRRILHALGQDIGEAAAAALAARAQALIAGAELPVGGMVDRPEATFAATLAALAADD